MMTAWSGSSSASNAALAGVLVGTSSTTHLAPMTTWPTQPPARWSWRKLAPLIRSGFETGKRSRRRRSNAELAAWSKKRKAIAVLADKDNSQLLPRMRDLIEHLRAERGLDDRIAAFDAEFVRAVALPPFGSGFFVATKLRCSPVIVIGTL